MKKRLFTGGMIFILIALISSAMFMVFDKKVHVNAASTVFVNQPYNVYFSQEITEQSIENGYLYLVDQNDRRVEAKITLDESKKMLSIINSKPGKYVLHVEKKAFVKPTAKTEKQTIDFTVVEKIEQLTSLQDIENYFQNVLNREMQYYNISESETFETAESSKAAADSAGEASNYSTTNNQVEDIEEGDIVVTDGHYIYSIVGTEIVITDASNPKSMTVVSKLNLEDDSYPTQLMIHGEKLIVLADQYIEMKKNDYITGTSMTKAIFYNVKNAAKPELIREVAQDGYMNGIRLTNDILYIVTNKTPDYWIMNQEEGVELRPYLYDSAIDEKMKPMDIKQISILPGSMEPSYTIISAIDLKNFDSKEVQTKGFLGGSSTLYMSPNALYLTAFNYNNLATPKDSSISSTALVKSILPMPSNTDIYKFTIDGLKVELSATTTIKGSLLNQFSMDEYNGFFRVAVTEGNTWGTGEQMSKNHLFILDEQLQKVGEVTNLAKGERIYSVRFMGERGYIVTFKQVDPLYVIDLENPKQPKVLGELKIPGYSNYLHPLDENHLIGFGYDTETRIDSYSKEPFVTTTGMKVSLFDVSDFSNPKEQDSVVIGHRGTFSDIQYNHKALFRNAKYHYFGFPITVYKAKGEFDVKYEGTGALVYEITAEEGIKLKGNLIKPAQAGEQYEDWTSMISRLLYIDDTLYTVSGSEIKSYDLQKFNELGSVKFN